MTLEQWNATYYAIPASEATGSDAEALEHSLWKWIGFREKYANGWEQSTSCALCKRYLDYSFNSITVGCRHCPLGIAGKECEAHDNNPYTLFLDTGNPEPMIEALAELLDIELAKENS